MVAATVLVRPRRRVAGLIPWRRRAEHPELEPAVLHHAWYYDETSPPSCPARSPSWPTSPPTTWTRASIDGAVNGVAGRPPGRRPACASCRPGTSATTPWVWPWARPCILFYVAAAGRGADREPSCNFPILTALIFLPAGGAVLVALIPAPGRTWPSCSAWRVALAGCPQHRHAGRLQHPRRRLPVRHQAELDPRLRDQLAPRRGRDLPLPRGADLRTPLPARPWPGRRSTASPGRSSAWMLLLEAGCSARFLALDLFVFFVMFEVDAGADVLPDRRLGLRQPGLRLSEVLRVHHGRLRLPAGRHLVARLPRRTRAAATSASTSSTSPGGPRRSARPTSASSFCAFVVAFAVKSPAVPVPHLAARRPHRGPDRGLGHPGRRPPEARRLRDPALRRLPLPQGGRRPGPAPADRWPSSASPTAPSWPPCRRTSSG